MALIHKSVSPFGDWIIFLNGVPLYKKWPTGRSVVFEKYGIHTDNRDRDNGHYGGTPHHKKETSAVEENPFKQRPKETLTTMISRLLEDFCVDDEHVARATRLFTVVVDAVYWKLDEGIADFNVAELRDHLNLKTLIDLNDPGKFPTMPIEVRAPIREYLWGLSGFLHERGYKQAQETFDCHGQSEMDLTKLLGSLADTYEQIFDEPLEPLRAADDVYGERGGVSTKWRSYLTSEEAASDEGGAAETTKSPMKGVPEDIVGIVNKLGYDPKVAYLLMGERMRWQDEIERLRKAADYISPYLRYTVGEESPGHHPTMPSAVAAFHVAFDIDTPEKRATRIRSSLKGSQN